MLFYETITFFADPPPIFMKTYNTYFGTEKSFNYNWGCMRRAENGEEVVLELSWWFWHGVQKLCLNNACMMYLYAELVLKWCWHDACARMVLTWCSHSAEAVLECAGMMQSWCRSCARMVLMVQAWCRNCAWIMLVWCSCMQNLC